MRTLKRETYQALDAYSGGLEAEEREPFLALRNQIDAYWQVLDKIVGWSPQERDRLRSSFFYNELVPRRTAMLQIADRIASVNELGLTHSEERAAASADSVRRYLLWTFAGTLGGGLFLALATIGFILGWSGSSICGGPIYRSCPRACCAPRKTNAARWRGSCTTRSGSLSRRF